MLASFRDLTLVDSTLLRLDTLFAGRYPGCRTNHSPVTGKVSLVYNVTAGHL